MSKAYYMGIIALGIVAAICGVVVLLRSQEGFLPGLILTLFGLLLSINTFFRFRKAKSSGTFRN